MSWGENIGWDHLSAKRAVDWWMNSEHHRANILSPNFVDLGVGVAFGNGHVLITQDFGAPVRPSGR